MVMMMNQDVIQDILLRLPVKSLVRCTCLSQNWYAFISYNKSFHSSYISRNTRCDQILKGFFLSKHAPLDEEMEEPVRFLPTSSDGRILSAPKKRKRCYNDDDDDDDAFPVDASLSFLGHDIVHVIGSSNGCLLATLERESTMTYMICNPLNKQQIVLPKPNLKTRLVVHGFTCDATLTHYKIVRALCFKPANYTTRLTLEIFSSDLPQWRTCNQTSPVGFFLDMTLRHSGMIKEGVIYLPAYLEKLTTTQTRQRCILIIASQSKETLQALEIPPREDDYYAHDFFGMSDGVIAYGCFEVDKLKIWLLNDKGDDTWEWSPKHIVSLKSKVENYFEYANEVSKGHVDLIAFHPSNSQVFFLNFGKNKYQYNVKKSRFKFICDFEKLGSRKGYEFFPYTYPLIGPHLFRA